MTIIEQLLAAGIPIDPEKSNEEAKTFVFISAMTPEQQLIFEDIVNPPSALELEKRVNTAGAYTGYAELPEFLKTMTADNATAYIHGAVLGGKTEAQINADIDALANTVAAMKAGLKTIGGSLVAIRDILELVVKLLLYIRDLIIRYRSA